MTESEMKEKKILESSEDSKEETTEETKEEEINQEKVVINNDKEISLTEDTSLQQEKKSYINLYICQISVGIIFAYLYIAISILMNVINRIIFHTYYFKFNFTILFCQQLFCLITFIILSMHI